MDAGFLNVVEIGQYFMTKDTAEFSQFHAVACREYTLPREDDSSQPRGWSQGNTKIGPVLEVTTSCLHGKYGIEIRIWSLSGDNTHSWVRISHRSNKFVMDSSNNDAEVPATYGSPKNLRPSQGSKLILEIHINYMMYKKNLEKKITELLSPKKWRNLEKFGWLVCRF